MWNYYRDEPNSGALGRSFDYKTSITRRLEGNIEKEVEISVPL